jgi:hypothetical protein
MTWSPAQWPLNRETHPSHRKRRSSGEFGIRGSAGVHRRRQWAKGVQNARRWQPAEQSRAWCWRRCRSVAEVALVASMPRDKVGLAWRLIAQDTGIDSAMADDREWIDRNRPIGSDRGKAEQDYVQGHCIDRKQGHASPQYQTHDKQSSTFTPVAYHRLRTTE